MRREAAPLLDLATVPRVLLHTAAQGAHPARAHCKQLLLALRCAAHLCSGGRGRRRSFGRFSRRLPESLFPPRILQELLHMRVFRHILLLRPAIQPRIHFLDLPDQRGVVRWHRCRGLLETLLLELVEHGLEISSLLELLRGGAREVALVGAEHARHARLPHLQHLLGRVGLVAVCAELPLHEVALAPHRLVPQEGVDGEVEEARVLQRTAVPAAQHMLEPFLQGHIQATSLALLLVRPVIAFSCLEDLGEGSRDVPRRVLAHHLQRFQSRGVHDNRVGKRLPRGAELLPRGLLPSTHVAGVEFLLLLLLRRR